MVYDSYKDDPLALQQIIDKNIELGFYDPEILELYTKEEIEQADGYIKHERDENIAYVGMEQFLESTAQNRATGIVYETPQVAYMMIALTLFSDYPKEERMRWVRDYYNAISNFDISLPTPSMAGFTLKDSPVSQ